MEETIKTYIATLLRNALTPFIVYLASTGYVSEDKATAFAVAGIAVAISVIWGLVNKFVFNKTIDTALKLPAGSPREALKEYN